MLLAWVKAKGAVVVTTSSKKERLEGYLAAGDLREWRVFLHDHLGFKVDIYISILPRRLSRGTFYLQPFIYDTANH